MEALYIQPFEEPEVMTENQEDGKTGGEQDDDRMEASSPMSSTTEEETDEDSEPEPPPVVCRKVSFADAFGLNLVSVKEFDNAEVTESEVSWSDGRKMAHSSDDFYLSCLFAVPSSLEELDQRLNTQMLELESIELLPGTTTLRGNIRVLNLCYDKSVYARVTLDHWMSYFDLLAEYIPGSSDRKTDRFTFRYTLVPPFKKGGTRVEFCLRYETPLGTFWANNQEMNYVLFCHQKGQTKERVAQTDEEGCSYKSKRSCLKARNGDAEDLTKGAISTNIVAADMEAAHKAERSGSETMDPAGMCFHQEEQKPWVESVKSRRRATRLARVQDYLLKTKQQQPKACSHDSVPGQTGSQHTSAPWGDSIHECQQIQSSESPQVLTYHQIPLLTLDWNNDPPCSGNADADDILTERPKMTLSNASEEKSVNDIWENADETSSNETSVSDVWQVFLNGPSCKDRSDVPESEWLQTAASVSPSNDKEPQIQYSAESQEFREFQAGIDTTTALRTLAARQLLSGTCEPLSALNSRDYQPEEACVSSPGDNNAATQDASQRSETNSVTDTPLESSLKRAEPLSGDADSPTECHKREVWERESEGIIAAGIGGDEPFTLHTADLVTSSGESQTTDMTAMPESHNASTVDMISQGARQDEGLSSNGEREVTSTAHNAVDDMLAFRETVRQETKDGVRCAFSAPRQEVEEGITMNYTEKKVSTGVEVFGLKETKKCTIYSKNADETQRKEFGQYQNRDYPSQMFEDNYEHGRINSTKVNDHGPENQKEAETEVVQRREDLASTQTEQSDGLKPKTDKEASALNQTGEVKRFSCDGKAMGRKEITPSANVTLIKDATESKKILPILHETPRLCPTDKFNSKPVEVVKLRWTHFQQELKSRNDDISREICREEDTEKQNAAKSDTPTEQQPEASRGTKEDLSQEDEKICFRKPKIEAIREMMCNAESPQGESKNAWKEQELSAEVESSPCGEYKKLSDEAKDPITAENRADLEEAWLEMDFIEKFGENLVSKIWEEVFVQEPSSRLTNTIDKVKIKLTDATQNFHLLFEKNTFDSGVFSLIELPTDSNVSLCQDLAQTSEAESNKYPSKHRGQSLNATEQTLSESHRDLDSSAHLSPDLPTAFAAQNVEPLFEFTNAFISPKDQGNCSQIKARSVTRLEADGQMEDGVFARKDSFDQSPQRLNSSNEKLKESDALLWWTILYTISHITRLLICTLLVGGFFVIVFVYDFPAFFALYIFSLCWWVYTWKRHRMTMANGMTG